MTGLEYLQFCAATAWQLAPTCEELHWQYSCLYNRALSRHRRPTGGVTPIYVAIPCLRTVWISRFKAVLTATEVTGAITVAVKKAENVKGVFLQGKQQHPTSDWQEAMWAVEIGLEVVTKTSVTFLGDLERGLPEKMARHFIKHTSETAWL
jgi:hypothetical protein